MSNLINVLTLTGKGDSHADEVKFTQFESLDEANAYCGGQQNMATKYWTICRIVDSGETVATYKELAE